MRAAVGEQRDDGELHVDVEAAVDAVVLQRADHLQAGAIADVREARIPVAAEIALQDSAVGGAVEERAPGLELADAVRRFLRVQLRHPPVVDVLAAAHRVGEVHLPAVAVVDVGERRRDAAFRHHGVRLAEQRFAEQPDLDAGGRRFDRGAEPRAARADDQHVVSSIGNLVTQRILQSVRRPSSTAGRRGRRAPTENRLAQANFMCLQLRQLAASYSLQPHRMPRELVQAPPTRCRSEWQPSV